MGSFKAAGLFDIKLFDIDIYNKTTSNNNNMSGRGRAGRGHGRGGAGRSGRGSNYTGSAQTRKTQGQCAELGTNVFDYGTPGAADQTRTSWKALVLHVGAKYGQDIGNELENRKTLVIPTPQHSAATLAAHQEATNRRDALAVKVKAFRELQLAALAARANDADDPDLDAAIEHAELECDMEQDAIKAAKPLPIKLEGDEYTTHSNAWKTHRDRTAALETQQGKTFAILRGQCSQVLIDKMECELEWQTVSESNDPLLLMGLNNR